MSDQQSSSYDSENSDNSSNESFISVPDGPAQNQERFRTCLNAWSRYKNKRTYPVIFRSDNQQHDDKFTSLRCRDMPQTREQLELNITNFSKPDQLDQTHIISPNYISSNLYPDLENFKQIYDQNSQNNIVNRIDQVIANIRLAKYGSIHKSTDYIHAGNQSHQLPHDIAQNINSNKIYNTENSISKIKKKFYYKNIKDYKDQRKSAIQKKYSHAAKRKLLKYYNSGIINKSSLCKYLKINYQSARTIVSNSFKNVNKIKLDVAPLKLKKVDELTIDQMYAYIKLNWDQTDTITSLLIKINDRFNLDLNYSQLYRLLLIFNLRLKDIKWRHQTYQDTDTIKARIIFADMISKFMLSMPTFFIDESFFRTHQAGRDRALALPDEQAVNVQLDKKKKMNVIACQDPMGTVQSYQISAFGYGNINYYDFLKQTVIKLREDYNGPICIVQDNLRCHTNKRSQDMLESRNIFGLGTAKYSSCESLIEAQWSLSKRRDKNLLLQEKIVPNYICDLLENVSQADSMGVGLQALNFIKNTLKNDQKEILVRIN